MDLWMYPGPSAVLETGVICQLKASAVHDRVVLGLNSRHMTGRSAMPGRVEMIITFYYILLL